MKTNSNKTVLVTGGTRGIGLSIASTMLALNYRVIVTGRKKRQGLDNGFEFMKVDFLNDSSIEKFLNDISRLEIDILINNAGINKIHPFEEIPVSDFDEIIKTNLRMPFLICQKLLPYMKKMNWGRIVNITSVFGQVSKEFRAPYSASKFGLDGLTIALASEVSEYNILANCVAPGFIDTELTRKILGESGIKKIKQQIPMGRLGTSEEIASLVCWLCSEENSYISGQNITIDGGFTRV